MVAYEVRRQADNFVDLADMQSLIARQLPADRARSGARLRQDGSHDDHYVDEENDYYEGEAVSPPALPCPPASRRPTVPGAPALWPFVRPIALPFQRFTMRRYRLSGRWTPGWWWAVWRRG